MAFKKLEQKITARFDIILSLNKHRLVTRYTDYLYLHTYVNTASVAAI